jgi:hypothetical protein
MRNVVQRSFATLALLLGIGHLIFGALVFKGFNLEAFWFSSFGLAMIVTALANYNPSKNWILTVQNSLTLTFVCALAFLAPQPQVLLGCILFAGLLLLSCFNKSASS